MRRPISPLPAAPLVSLAILAGLAATPALAIDGYPDSGFGANGSARIPFDLAGTLADLGNAVALDAAARIVIVGSVDNGLLGLDCGVARLLPDGGLDPGFDGDGRATWNLATDATYNDECTDVAIGANDDIYAAAIDGQGKLRVLRFPGGSSFGVAVPHDGPPRLALQPDGKILLAWSDGDFHVCRHLGLSVNLDPQFGNGGCVTVPFDLGGGLNDDLHDVALQPDGKILLAGAAEWGGADYDFAVARLTANGSLDAGFGAGGKLAVAIDLAGLADVAYAVAVAESGAIVLAGAAAVSIFATEAAVATVASDGAFHSTTHYYVAGSTVASGVAVQDDGRIVVAGWTDLVTQDLFSVVRLMPDLAWDATFAGGYYEFDPVTGGEARSLGLALQGGRAVAAGWAEWAAPDWDFAVMRLTAALVFADGFERGSTGHWSSAAP